MNRTRWRHSTVQMLPKVDRPKTIEIIEGPRCFLRWPECVQFVWSTFKRLKRLWAPARFSFELCLVCFVILVINFGGQISIQTILIILNMGLGAGIIGYFTGDIYVPLSTYHQCYHQAKQLNGHTLYVYDSCIICQCEFNHNGDYVIWRVSCDKNITTITVELTLKNDTKWVSYHIFVTWHLLDYIITIVVEFTLKNDARIIYIHIMKLPKMVSLIMNHTLPSIHIKKPVLDIYNMSNIGWMSNALLK